MRKQVNCPVCALDGYTTEMKYQQRDDFFKCDRCGAELWGKGEQWIDAIVKLKNESIADTYVSLALQPGEKVMGGGGSTGHAKKAGKKKSLAQINKELCGSSRGKNRAYD